MTDITGLNKAYQEKKQKTNKFNYIHKNKKQEWR